MNISRGLRRGAVVLAILGLNAGLIANTQTPAKPPVKKKAPVAKIAPAPVAAPVKEPEPPPPTDVQMHMKITTGAQVSETTTLIRGPRQRVEFPGMTVIQQCDLNRTLQINDQSKHYLVQKHQTAEPAATPAPASDALAQQQAMQQQTMGQMGGGHGKPPAPKGGVITYTTTITDTGEKKAFFDREARRVKTVIVGESSEPACSKVKQRIEVDAWYLGVPETMAGCTPKAEGKPPAPSADACVDRMETRTVGDAKLGFPVVSTTTTTSGEGAEADSSSVKMEVDKLEITRLDAALFDVPAGYTEVASYTDLIPSMASGGTLADALLGSVKNGTRQVLPKEAGAIRIGVPEPANKAQRDLSGRQLQDELVANFTKWPYEAVPLYGSTPDELQRDAKAKECDHVLVITVDEAKTSHPSKAGGFLKAVSGDGPPKDTHDVKMDYKLFDVTAPDKVESSAMTKASSGGGFGLKSALKLAAFAGQMYMGFGMNRMMMGQFGGALGASSLMGGGMGMFNPTMGAMNMVMSGASSMAMSGMTGGGPGGDIAGMQNDQAFHQTMSKALDNVSDEVTTDLKKPKAGAKK